MDGVRWWRRVVEEDDGQPTDAGGAASTGGPTATGQRHHGPGGLHPADVAGDPPVPHILDEGDVIIRTSLTTPIVGTTEQSDPVVAYEADEIDADTRTGWSVVVTGVAQPVRDPLDRARYEALLDCGADDPADCVLRIRPEIATGLRVTPYPEN